MKRLEMPAFFMNAGHCNRAMPFLTNFSQSSEYDIAGEAIYGMKGSV